MTTDFPTWMTEATRLTRQGQLAAATALIQRSLGAPAEPPTQEPPTQEPHQDTGRDPLEGSARVLDDDPPTAPAAATAGQASSQADRHTRNAAGPLRGTSGRVRPPVMPLDASSLGGLTELLKRPPLTGHRPPVADSPGGRFLTETYSGPAGTRAYRLYVPRGYTGQPVPLVVLLHGCTQGPEDFATGTGMNALAEAQTFLVAYPAQAATENSSRCWNWHEAAHQSGARGEPALIAGLTRQVMGTYRIDPRRVSVAGLSAGGALAAVLGATHPELFAAVGVHSGLAYGAASDLPSALAAMQRGQAGTALSGPASRLPPLILFHGERDTTVSPRNADHLLEQWLAAHGARAVRETTEQTTGGQRATRTVYRAASGRTVVEVWRVAGLGHAWFGGNPGGTFTDARGPDASAELVRFFAEHPRL